MANPVAVGNFTKKSQYDHLYDALNGKLLQHVETIVTTDDMTSGISATPTYADVVPDSGVDLVSSTLPAGTYFAIARLYGLSNDSGTSIADPAFTGLRARFEYGGSTLATGGDGLSTDTDFVGGPYYWDSLLFRSNIVIFGFITLASADQIAVQVAMASGAASASLFSGCSLSIFELWGG